MKWRTERVCRALSIEPWSKAEASFRFGVTKSRLSWLSSNLAADSVFCLYNEPSKNYKQCVLKQNALFWCVTFLVAAALTGILTSYFSEDSRMRRRRRKSHRKLIAKTRRPIVRFSVRPPKEDKS